MEETSKKQEKNMDDKALTHMSLSICSATQGTTG